MPKKKSVCDIWLSNTDKKNYYTSTNGARIKERYKYIYASMIDSKAYLDLSHGARSMFTVMILLSYEPKLRNKIGNNAFYFNNAVAVKYGFAQPQQRKKYIQELINHGFIERQPTRRNTKSIYLLSDGWKKWNGQPIEDFTANMTESQKHYHKVIENFKNRSVSHEDYRQGKTEDS